MLESMIDNVKQGKDEKVNTDEIIDMLKNIGNENVEETSKVETIEVKPTMELNVYDINIIKQAYQKGYKVFSVTVELYENTLLKSARAYLVHNTVEELGEIIKTNPTVEDLEQEKFENTFSIMVITQKSLNDVKTAIERISEIKDVKVIEVFLNDSTTETTETEISTNIVNKNEPKADEDKNAKKVHQSVRVDLERLDMLMTLVGELVIHRTRLEQLTNNHKLGDLNETLEQVGRITSDLQDLVMKVRMLPVERVFNRFPRMVRDLAHELNKDIDLIIEGETTELDRTVIEEIGEPLVHLIRNAADHGLESPEERIRNGKSSKGTIKLIAYQEGNKAVIKVEDDGKGLDLGKIRNKANNSGIDTEGMTEGDIKNLIFMQGFSTSDKVTDVSGRGVGMDVVKTKISTLGGTIDVVSESGKGTAVIVRLPLTLSIIQALLVNVGEDTFAISLGFVDKIININVDDIRTTNNKEIILYRGNVIPLVRAAKKLNISENDNKDKFVVIVKVGERTIGILVDSLSGQQEIVIKTVGKTLQNLKEYVGATILGDGLVTLILDVAALV
jgi:two-component system chemotaxis sensor kinase CheA